MHVPQQIAALIADPAPLHGAQQRHAAAFAAWRAQPETAAVFDSFAAFADGAPLSALPRLAALFDGQSGHAFAFAGGLVTALLPALAADPLGQVPVRHQSARATTRLMLDRKGDATLTLMAIDGEALAAQPACAAAPFSPAEEWDAVLAGRGTARLIERKGALAPAAHPLPLAPGTALGRDAAREALLVDSAERGLVLIRLQRRRPGPEPSVEISLADGAELRRAAASSRESRHELAAALLGRMRRTDAAPLLAQIAQEAEHGDSLRWQALRESLGLDTMAGYTALLAVARNADDPLSAPAGALRARLIEQYPVLAELTSCPV